MSKWFRNPSSLIERSQTLRLGIYNLNLTFKPSLAVSLFWFFSSSPAHKNPRPFLLLGTSQLSVPTVAETQPVHRRLQFPQAVFISAPLFHVPLSSRKCLHMGVVCYLLDKRTERTEPWTSASYTCLSGWFLHRKLRYFLTLAQWLKLFNFNPTMALCFDLV